MILDKLGSSATLLKFIKFGFRKTSQMASLKVLNIILFRMKNYHPICILIVLLTVASKQIPLNQLENIFLIIFA